MRNFQTMIQTTFLHVMKVALRNNYWLHTNFLFLSFKEFPLILGSITSMYKLGLSNITLKIPEILLLFNILVRI